MPAKVRIDLDEVLRSGKPVVVVLGCGEKKHSGAIGVDCRDLPQVDVVTDLEEGLPFLGDNSVDEIIAEHVLEHIDNFEGLMREIVRVLKPGGVCSVAVPHFANPYGYSDYTHKRFFGLYTFYYFVAPENQLRRKVPGYCDARIRIVNIRLIFRQHKRLLRLLAPLFGRIVNLCPLFQEWYEAKPWSIPCDDIRIVFTPDK